MKSNECFWFHIHRHIIQSIYLITFDLEEIKTKFKYNFHFLKLKVFILSVMNLARSQTWIV